jgi:hypothetical protein
VLNVPVLQVMLERSGITPGEVVAQPAHRQLGAAADWPLVPRSQFELSRKAILNPSGVSEMPPFWQYSRHRATGTKRV